MLDLAPGILPSRLKALPTPHPEVVPLRAYDMGNVPAAEPGLAEVLERVIADGISVIAASQCHQTQMFPGHYEAGDATARMGAVGAGDMTLEVVYSKIVLLLSQGLHGNSPATWIGRPIAGELTLPMFQWASSPIKARRVLHKRSVFRRLRAPGQRSKYETVCGRRSAGYYRRFKVRVFTHHGDHRVDLGQWEPVDHETTNVEDATGK